MNAPLDLSKVTVLDRDVRHSGRTFSLVTETVDLGGPKSAKLDIVRHPGAVAVISLTDDNCVILLEQYRHAIGGFIWEIPAGTLESGEDPLDAAQRELTEETGYVAAQWDAMGLLTPVPGYSDEQQHLFVARQLTMTTQDLDPDEYLSVHSIPLDEAMAMVDDGRIHDGKTVAALLRLDRQHRIGT